MQTDTPKTHTGPVDATRAEGAESVSALSTDGQPRRLSEPVRAGIYKYAPHLRVLMVIVAVPTVIALAGFGLTYQPKSSEVRKSAQLAGVQIVQADNVAARKELLQAAAAQRVTVDVEGTKYVFTPKELGMKREVDQLLNATYSAKPSVLTRLSSKKTVAPALQTYIPKSQMQAAIEKKMGSYQTSVDAAVTVNGESLVVQPGRAGIAIDFDELVQELSKSDLRQNVTVNAHYTKREPAISTQAATDAKNKAETLLAATYGVQTDVGGSKQASRAQRASWLEFKPREDKQHIDVSLNPAAAKTTMNQLASSFNRSAKDKVTVTLVDKPALVVDNGEDGLTVDRQALDKELGALQTAIATGQSYTMSLKLSVVSAGERNLGSATGGKFVLVDKQALRAYAINVDTVDRTMLVSTGVARMPTPTGHFKILSKTPLVTMRGCNKAVGCWVVPNVPNAEFFTTDGDALHGTYWHNNFGKKNMSHGCVNLTLADAAWLYDWTEVGTDVIIV